MTGLDRARGVTLLEMLFTTATVSALLSLGVPSLVSIANDVRQSTMANGFLADLAMARTESIKRGQRVVLCASSDGLSCVKSGSWQQGRILFEDRNNNAERDPGERVLLTEAAAPSDWLIRGNGTVATYISYHPRGRTRMTNGAFQAGTVTLCRRSPAGVRATQIVISSAGRPRSQSRSVDSCT